IYRRAASFTISTSFSVILTMSMLRARLLRTETRRLLLRLGVTDEAAGRVVACAGAADAASRRPRGHAQSGPPRGPGLRRAPNAPSSCVVFEVLPEGV